MAPWRWTGRAGQPGIAGLALKALVGLAPRAAVALGRPQVGHRGRVLVDHDRLGVRLPGRHRADGFDAKLDKRLNM